MPFFNLLDLSVQKRWVKMISSKFSGIARHVAPRQHIYDEMSFLKLLPSSVSFRKKCGWAPCRLGSLGILSHK